MNWLNAAFAFVFFCNLIFMVGAAYALVRILDATERSQIELQNAASHVVEVGSHIKVVVRRAFTEMERTNDILEARESSSGRAVSELSFQIKSLVDRLKVVMAKNAGVVAGAIAEGAGAGVGADGTEAAALYTPNAEDQRAKLHAELEAALHKNHKLQDEIDQTHYRLKDASHANKALQEEIKEVKGLKQSVADSLMQRTQDLEAQLEKARERAKAAEKHAEANAFQLDEIRAQISAQKFPAAGNGSESGSGIGGGSIDGGIDQSELIAGQQDQIDVLAAREKALMARIDQLEGAFQRNQTEKQFIEDRFLKMDAADSRAPTTNPGPAPDPA